MSDALTRINAFVSDTTAPEPAQDIVMHQTRGGELKDEVLKARGGDSTSAIACRNVDAIRSSPALNRKRDELPVKQSLLCRGH